MQKLCLLLVSLLLTSCFNDLPTPTKMNQEEDQLIRAAFPFTTLEITGPADQPNVLLREGDKLVFRYALSKLAPVKNTVHILFEIDRLEEQFSLNNLRNEKAVYGKQVENESLVYQQILSGNISGRKINDQQWDVSINVSGGTGNTDFNISESGIYLIQ